MKITSRDRAHRCRSAIKGVFDALNQHCDGLLSQFTTGEQSLARMLKSPVCPLACSVALCVSELCDSEYLDQYSLTLLRNSGKYSKIFVQTQVRAADNFRKAIKNFSFAMQRFDSLSEPLHRIFLLLPEVMVFLGELSRVGDRADAQWARSLLRSLTGPESYVKVLSAALASDCFLVCQKFLRKDDSADAEVFMKAGEARLANSGS